MNIDLSKVRALDWVLKKPHVNSTCIGCSACVAVTGWEYFELNSDGLSCVIHNASYDETMVEDAIVTCPVNAISWQPCDGNGAYVDGITEHQDVA